MDGDNRVLQLSRLDNNAMEDSPEPVQCQILAEVDTEEMQIKKYPRFNDQGN